MKTGSLCLRPWALRMRCTWTWQAPLSTFKPLGRFVVTTNLVRGPWVGSWRPQTLSTPWVGSWTHKPRQTPWVGSWRPQTSSEALGSVRGVTNLVITPGSVPGVTTLSSPLGRFVKPTNLVSGHWVGSWSHKPRQRPLGRFVEPTNLVRGHWVGSWRPQTLLHPRLVRGDHKPCHKLESVWSQDPYPTNLVGSGRNRSHVIFPDQPSSPLCYAPPIQKPRAQWQVCLSLHSYLYGHSSVLPLIHHQPTADPDTICLIFIIDTFLYQNSPFRLFSPRLFVSSGFDPSSRNARKTTCTRLSWPRSQVCKAHGRLAWLLAARRRVSVC